MNKSTTSMFAVLVLISLLASAFAAYDIFWKETVREKKLGRLETSEIFSLRTNKKLVGGTANEEDCSIVLSIRYNKNRNRVYEWYISDNPQEEGFWYDVIEYVENRPVEANVIRIKHNLLW